MAEKTNIEWCAHTFNPIRGCQRVSDGCKFCYAETLSKRNPATLGEWGPNGTRVVAAESYWKQPIKWNRQAEVAGERRRVFCASLADVFEDRPEWIEPRDRLFQLIDSTPHLDWLLLTKRPENIERLWPFGFYDEQFSWPNIWLGTSVENQATADERIPHLLNVPAKVRFLSCEPLLGAVELNLLRSAFCPDCGEWKSQTETYCTDCYEWNLRDSIKISQINWVIVGGESGPNARPFEAWWARALKNQCEDAGVPFFLKQLGSNPCGSFENADDWPNQGMGDLIGQTILRDKKGGDMDEWPEALRVRHVPEVE